MSAVKEPQPGLRRPTGNRSAYVGKWVESLETSDVNQLWAELHRVVCYHPLVRASRSAGLLVEDDSRGNAYKDLTQELFVVLLSKERFQHYLDTEMTNQEIELEIGQIELTNLLTAELRKRYPESYRLARRISTLVQTSRNFRRFDVAAGATPTHRRLSQRIYGLSFWSDNKPQREQAELEARIGNVPMRQRDTRKVGCTGDAQVVINNHDLENLIVSVLETVDSPADIRTMRSLVMSRLPVMDIYLVPIGGSDDEDGKETTYLEPVDGKETPLQSLLTRESLHEAAGSVDHFLICLNEAVRSKTKQYNRILGVLWHCYLSQEGCTQLEVAAVLGVSDSLVSEYRRRIETQLQNLAFTELEQARQFEQALRQKVSQLIANDNQTAGV